MNTRMLQWRRLQLPAAAVIWLATASVLLGVQTETRLAAMTVLLAGSAVLFFSVTDRTAFFVYILFTLVTVFYFLYLAFADGWSPGRQAMGIGLHFLFLLHLFALYSLAKYVFAYRKENAALKERVEELREFISEQGVLTKREFDKQATLVLSSMARHEERGYFLKADLSALRKSARKQAVLAASAAIYGTLRKQYDLVGQWDGTTLVVVLQNVSEEGFAIVEARLQDALARQLEPEALERIRWESRRIDGQRSVGELLVIA